MSADRGEPEFLAQKLFIGAVLLIAAAVLVSACSSNSAAPLPYTVSGTVTGENGPVADAIVQIVGTSNQVRTDKTGAFQLHGSGLGGTSPVTVSAWTEGHFIGLAHLDPKKLAAQPNDQAVAIKLQPLFNTDNHQYTWFEFEGVSGSASCGLCHREFKEWQADGHSQSAVNPRFISMYRGTNLAGKKGQLTQMVKMDTALPPDPSLPHYGPGFRLDNPDRAGNCAACHTPVAEKTDNMNSCAWSGCHSSTTAERAATTGLNVAGVMPVGMVGIGTQGVACEFCHVIGGVNVDPKTHLPPPDAPGIQSLQLRRPPDGQKQFIGTIVDPNRESVTYSPFLAQSEFCAACHYGVFGGVVSNMRVTGGTVIYNSYGEWLNSPYSDPKTGKTCQDCHMPAKDTLYSVFPEKGGVARDYMKYHDHTMAGPSSQSLMWNAVTMKAGATQTGSVLTLQVDITNDKTGHAVPTDAPIRSMMLIVEARDASGKLLKPKSGPVLPDWTGNYAGQPGRGFAKILRDDWTGETPTGAFWRKTTIVEDTRLMPLATDSTAYAFDAADGAVASIKVKLVYRRAFQKLAAQKDWTDPDQVMAEAAVAIPTTK